MSAPWCGRPLPDDRDGWKARAMAFREIAHEANTKYELLVQEVQRAATLLDFEAHLGSPEHQATLREVVRQLTAALDQGAMSDLCAHRDDRGR